MKCGCLLMALVLLMLQGSCATQNVGGGSLWDDEWNIRITVP
jgi:hypothetical protein